MGLPRTIVADPPWLPKLHAGMTVFGRQKARPQMLYPTMSVDEICRFDVPPTAGKAHLYLWVLSQHADWGYQVARAWGFEPQILLTWAKPILGLGRFQCNTEQILVARKGGPVRNAFGFTRGTWFNWPRGRHSAKPDGFYAMVERVSPGPYVELFARRRRPGWDCRGNQLPDEPQLLAG